MLLTSGDLHKAFPKLQFPAGMVGQVESETTAGVLNPRLFVEAELTVALNQGATAIPERVVAIEPGRTSVEITTTTGNRYEADKVLVAAGAWSHFLLKRPVQIILEAVAVVMAEVPASEAFAFPSLIYNRIPTDPSAAAGYLMSAVDYPDGKFYVKGGWYWSSTVVETEAELNAYFRSAITRNSGKPDRELFTEIVPSLQQAKSWSYKPCVHMRTPTHLPYIDEIEPDRIYVAFGGNGLAAKCGDEIGRLGAELTASGSWQDDELTADDFQGRLRLTAHFRPIAAINIKLPPLCPFPSKSDCPGDLPTRTAYCLLLITKQDPHREDMVRGEPHVHPVQEHAYVRGWTRDSPLRYRTK